MMVTILGGRYRRQGHSWGALGLAVGRLVVVIAVTVGVSSALAARVSQEMAVRAAQNMASLHVRQSGDWRGSLTPVVESVETLTYNDLPVGYLVRIQPAGSMLVAYYDDFSPVIFYSPSYTLDPAKLDQQESLESWLLPETYNNIQRINAHYAANGTTIDAASPSQARIVGTNVTRSASKVAQAWEVFDVPSDKFSASVVADQVKRSREANVMPTAVTPLLATRWNQDGNYRMYTPAGSTCTHTYAGCVATAMAQVMKYWNWPDVGQGSHSYVWNSTTLSANFAHVYNWASMPNQLTVSSTATQNDAIARLMSDVGIAVNMNYGCGGSGASPYAAYDALKTYFKYKNSLQLLYRGNYTTANWMNLIKGELNATKPRPVLFSIYTTDNTSGHEVVIDGYQTVVTDQVHINYGWSGYYDGYYDITNNWTASGTWAANDQYVIVGIEPSVPVSSYEVSVKKVGEGVGTVTSSPSGVNCGSSCGANFAVGATVKLTATPTTGMFVGWYGACSGVAPTCTLTVDSAKSVTARFDTNTNVLGSVVDNRGIVFVSGSSMGGEGVKAWEPDASEAHTGAESLRSGAIADNDSSWLETSVRGPISIKFDWKVSSERSYDYLSLYVDGSRWSAISGEQDWTTVTFSLPVGQHLVSWVYEKDYVMSSGADAGWVDSLVMSPFPDVPVSSSMANYINAIYSAGITTGCGGGNFCPAQSVTRDQMAALIVRAKEGEPAVGCSTAPFSDVSTTNSFCKYIQRMSALGVTTGCGGGNYCPTQTVSRDQMAAFIVRALERDYPASYCGGVSPFSDVPVSSTFCGNIKRLSELNITTGCAAGRYCPTQTVTRDQMAAFLARAFLGM